MPDRLTADAIRHGIADRLFADSLQMPLPVAADGGVFLSGNGTPVCAEHGALAGPSSGGQRVQDADGSTDAGGLSQTAGTGRIEDFNHNDRFQSVRSYGMKRMIGMNRFRHGRRIGNRCKYRLRGSLWRSHKRRVPEQREAAPGLRESLLGYAADFSGSGTRVSGSISGSAGISCGTCCGSYGIGSGISTMLRIGTVPCEDAGVGAGSAVIRVGCRCDVLRTFDMT